MNAVDYILAIGGPQDIALTTGNASYTFSQVRSIVRGAARCLAAHGVRPGDRVGILAKNSLFWAAAYFGAMKLGAIAFPIPYRTPAEKVFRLLSWTGCKVVCVLTGVEDSHPGLACQEVTVVTEPELCDGRSDSAVPPTDDFIPIDEHSTVAALILTSGSTREPRAVMISHRNIIANTQSIIGCLGLSAADRILCVLPFSYCFGSSLLHSHLAVGGSVVLGGETFNATACIQSIELNGCNGFAGVPSVFQVLLRSDAVRGKTLPTILSKIQQAGGKLASQFVEELRQAAPHAELYIMYGQTEATARLSCLPHRMLPLKLGSVGLAIPGVRLTIVADDGRIVKAAEVGEVVAEGENVALGYWRDPAATADAFKDGRLFTGDRGYYDEDGYIYLVGREHDFIKSGG